MHIFTISSSNYVLQLSVQERQMLAVANTWQRRQGHILSPGSTQAAVVARTTKCASTRKGTFNLQVFLEDNILPVHHRHWLGGP